MEVIKRNIRNKEKVIEKGKMHVDVIDCRRLCLRFPPKDYNKRVVSDMLVNLTQEETKKIKKVLNRVQLR